MANLPVGGALVDLVERSLNNEVSGLTGTTENKMNAIFSDNVHLTPLGMYFVSSVVYSAIYGKSPANTTPPATSGVSTATAQDLQNIAWNYINTYYSQNSLGTPRSMASCRDFMRTEYCSSYFNHTNRANQISSCVSTNGENETNGYFRWPDSNYSPLPVP